MIQIYLDENLSEHVAVALNALNKGYFCDVEVISTKERFGKGAPDEAIIPEVGKENGILITRDINIKRVQLQYALCKEFNLGIFFLKMPKNFDRHWDIVRSLINHWEEIIEMVRKTNKPFAFIIPSNRKLEKLKD